MTIRNETAAGFADHDTRTGLRIFDRIRLAWRRAAVRRQIINELEPMRDRDLVDLGISRADIRSLAAQHAEMTVPPLPHRR